MVLILNLETEESRQELKAILQKIISETPDKSNDEELVDTNELKAITGVSSLTTVNKWHHMGLPYIKGRPNRYRRGDIKAFLSKHKINGRGN
jgi:hypothetical protein